MTYRLYWIENVLNFGDLLSPVIFDHFGVGYVRSHTPEVLCVGSVAKMARAGTVVLGSGAHRIDIRPNPKADWRFVRGPITRTLVSKAGGTCPEVYGDAGMLLPLICPESEKEHEVGIVPHYVDYETAKQRHPGMKIIDVINADPLVVAREITKCRRIISSSLHGLICAHAYGIPAAWTSFGGRILGDGTKFRDHYLCGGIEPVMSTVEDPVYQLVEFNTKPIERVFRSL